MEGEKKRELDNQMIEDIMVVRRILNEAIISVRRVFGSFIGKDSSSGCS